MTPSDFASSLRSYCMATGASVTSWGRTVKHNRLVGGIPTSAHLVWIAADVVYDNKPGEAYRKMLAAQLGLKVVMETDHDHLQPFT